MNSRVDCKTSSLFCKTRFCWSNYCKMDDHIENYYLILQAKRALVTHAAWKCCPNSKSSHPTELQFLIIITHKEVLNTYRISKHEKKAQPSLLFSMYNITSFCLWIENDEFLSLLLAKMKNVAVFVNGSSALGIESSLLKKNSFELTKMEDWDSKRHGLWVLPVFISLEFRNKESKSLIPIAWSM